MTPLTHKEHRWPGEEIRSIADASRFIVQNTAAEFVRDRRGSIVAMIGSLTCTQFGTVTEVLVQHDVEGGNEWGQRAIVAVSDESTILLYRNIGS